MIYACWLIISIATSTPLHSQKKGAWILNRVLNTDNGLPQNTINDLYFDKATGFLWIATEGGAILYNGVSTKIFDITNIPSFKMARMSGFRLTADSNVVVIDRSGIGMRINGNGIDTSYAANYTIEGNRFISSLQLPELKNNIPFKKRLDSLDQIAGEPGSVSYFFDKHTTLGISFKTIYLFEPTVYKININTPGDPIFIKVNKNCVAILNRHTGKGYCFDIHKKTVVPVEIPATFTLAKNAIIYTDELLQTAYLLNEKKLYALSIGEHGIEPQLIAELPQIPQNISCISVHPKKNQVYLGKL